MQWVYLAIAIGAELIGTMSLRASDGFRKMVWLIPTVLGYLTAFGGLALSLAEGMPVGIAYGIWAAVGVALTAVVAWILFDDPLTWLMGAGIALIAGGVLIIEIGAAH
jgi:small multidrug resistance pump